MATKHSAPRLPRQDWTVELLDTRLRVFHAVATTGSFRRAATALYLSQPGVSFHIQSLETMMGTPLFIRSYHEITLTNAGKRLHEYTRKLVELTGEAAADLAAMSARASSRLAVGVTNIVATYIFPSVIGRFLSDYDGLSVSWEIGSSDPIIQAVADGTVDLGIVSDPVSRPGVEVEPFFEDELILIASPRHEWALDLQPRTLKEVTGQPMVLRGAGSGTRGTIEKYLESEGLSLAQCTIAMEVGTVETVKALVASNIGVSIVPHIAVRAELTMGSLVRIPLVDVCLRRNFNIVYQKRKRLNGVACAFLEFLRSLRGSGALPIPTVTAPGSSR